MQLKLSVYSPPTATNLLVDVYYNIQTTTPTYLCQVIADYISYHKSYGSSNVGNTVDTSMEYLAMTLHYVPHDYISS